MSGRTFLLQDWTTIRSSLNQPFTQDPQLWLDLNGFADATCWIDVTEVTPPATGASVGLAVQTAPSSDDSYFQAMAPALNYGAAAPFNPPASTPLVIRSAQSLTSNNLMRYVRWQITPSTNGAWDITFRIRVVANRSTAFVPTLLSGCILWLRADIGVVLSSGTSISTWADQSGQGNNATSAAAQPTYSTNAMNGLPAIKGNGSTQYMTTAAFTIGASTTIFAAVQPSAAPQSAYTRILEQQNSSTYYLGVDTNGTKYKLIVNDNTSPYGVAQGGTVTSTANTIVTGTYASPAGTVYVNGVSVGSDSFTAPTPASQTLYIMESFNASNAYWNGYLAEAIIFNRGLSASELMRVHRYLGARYGVVVP